MAGAGQWTPQRTRHALSGNQPRRAIRALTGHWTTPSAARMLNEHLHRIAEARESERRVRGDRPLTPGELDLGEAAIDKAVADVVDASTGRDPLDIRRDRSAAIGSGARAWSPVSMLDLGPLDDLVAAPVFGPGEDLREWLVSIADVSATRPAGSPADSRSGVPPPTVALLLVDILLAAPHGPTPAGVTLAAA